MKNNFSLPDWFQSVYQHFNCAEQLPHAILFSGIKGIGKNNFVEHFASALLCTDNHSQLDACGQCHSCTLMKSKGNPDYLLIKRAEGKKNISIEQIRQLIDWLSLSASLGEHRCVVIKEPELMTIEAANALLKTLEEPSTGVFILLLSNFPHQLLATIRSRCVHYPITPPNSELAINWLAQYFNNNEISKKELSCALKLANNAPFAALDILQQQRLSLWQGFIQNFIAYCEQTTDNFPLSIDKKPIPLSDALSWLLILLCDVIKSQHGLAESFADDNYQHLQLSLAKNTKVQDLYFFVDDLHQYFENPNFSVLNEQLAWESYLLRFKNCCLIEK